MKILVVQCTVSDLKPLSLYLAHPKRNIACPKLALDIITAQFFSLGAKLLILPTLLKEFK